MDTDEGPAFAALRRGKKDLKDIKDIKDLKDDFPEPFRSALLVFIWRGF